MTKTEEMMKKFAENLKSIEPNTGYMLSVVDFSTVNMYSRTNLHMADMAALMMDSYYSMASKCNMSYSEAVKLLAKTSINMLACNSLGVVPQEDIRAMVLEQVKKAIEEDKNND